MRMVKTFEALASEPRLKILAYLSKATMTAGEIAERFDMAKPSLSKHLSILENAGLIRREVRGRTHFCRLDPGPLASAHEWLSFYERFWSNRLDVLEQLLRDEDASKSANPKTQSRGHRKGDDQ